MCIGIAGYMGAGKTTCARAFVSKHTSVIDADTEAKAAMLRSAGLRDDLRAAFGESVADADGTLRFGELGRLVFESADSLRTFNGIVRSHIAPHFEELVRGCGKPLCILDAALIPLWGLESRFDFCVWADVPFGERYRRLRAKLPDMEDAVLLRRMRLQEEVMAVPDGGNWVRLPDADCREYIINRIRQSSHRNEILDALSRSVSKC
jgi:dephospho-CoA kinase